MATLGFPKSDVQGALCTLKLLLNLIRRLNNKITTSCGEGQIEHVQSDAKHLHLPGSS